MNTKYIHFNRVLNDKYNKKTFYSKQYVTIVNNDDGTCTNDKPVEKTLNFSESDK